MLFGTLRQLRISRFALLGAVVALASYGVSSILKVSIDGQIRAANAIRDRAAEIEHSLTLFPFFRAHLYAQKEQNDVLKLVLNLMLRNLGTTGLPRFDSSLLTMDSGNPFDVSVEFGPGLMANGFLGQLPPALAMTALPAGDYVFDPKAKLHSNANLAACTRAAVRQGQAAEDLLSEIAKNYPQLEVYPARLSDYIAGVNLRSQMLVDWNIRLPERLGIYDVTNLENAADAAKLEGSFHDYGMIKSKCIQVARQQINEDYRAALIHVRNTVSTEQILPLTRKRKLVELAEMILYAFGALLALAKQAKPADTMIT